MTVTATAAMMMVATSISFPSYARPRRRPQKRAATAAATISAVASEAMALTLTLGERFEQFDRHDTLGERSTGGPSRL